MRGYNSIKIKIRKKKPKRRERERIGERYIIRVNDNDRQNKINPGPGYRKIRGYDETILKGIKENEKKEIQHEGVGSGSR